jgi:hypothetical protein
MGRVGMISRDVLNTNRHRAARGKSSFLWNRGRCRPAWRQRPRLVAATILAAVEGGILPSGIGDGVAGEPPGRMPGFTAGWKPAATPAAGSAGEIARATVTAGRLRRRHGRAGARLSFSPAFVGPSRFGWELPEPPWLTG